MWIRLNGAEGAETGGEDRVSGIKIDCFEGRSSAKVFLLALTCNTFGLLPTGLWRGVN